MIPASTFKTLTTVASLDLLGPEFRFTTELIAGGRNGGLLEGDLVFRGGGDPTLSMEDLERLATGLVDDGISRIAGGVVGDGTLFPANMAGDFWGWGDIGNGYGSPTSGLNLGHNRFVVTFRPGAKVGDAAELVGASPHVPEVEWINRVTTGPSGSGDQVMIHAGPLATRIQLSGSVPIGRAFAVRGAVPDPPLFAAHHLDRLLRERGVTIGRPPRSRGDGEPSAGGEPVRQRKSATLAEILPGLHARSDNHETECLFQMIGVKAGQPATVALVDYWRERGVENLRIVDGSGLSRADFISAEDLARVQVIAARGPHAGIYRGSLSPAHDGKVRWKGGAMSAVRTWTGYVEAGDGRTYGFALMFNHYRDGSKLDAWRDALLAEVIARP
jgi:D-alanyl-D-alanine carboxypeptidase/D-alanyl-D-alanine-endopeptidase (penicillin-binding protein 4)